MSDADDLVMAAQKQLSEHCAWLAGEIMKIPQDDPCLGGDKIRLVLQARTITLRVVKTSAQTASVVWDYPDELHAWLSSAAAPKHLRDSLAGGHVVDPNRPASSVVSEVEQ